MIAHLMVPGLCRRHLDADWLPFAGDPPAARADLVCTFPASIETVEATLLTGTEPATHGHWTPGEAATVPWIDGTPTVEHRRDDRVALARRAAIDDPAGERAALQEIGDLIRTLRVRVDVLLVTGGPAFAATPRRVDPPVDLIALGSIAIAPERLNATSRDALLDTPGVGRVLDGDALLSWHAPPVAAAVVAEPEWSFTDAACACGRRDLDGTADGAVVLGWGGGLGHWPRAVHDVRIAPTLAAHAGIDLPGAVDKPLRGG